MCTSPWAPCYNVGSHSFGPGGAWDSAFSTNSQEVPEQWGSGPVAYLSSWLAWPALSHLRAGRLSLVAAASGASLALTQPWPVTSWATSSSWASLRPSMVVWFLGLTCSVHVSKPFGERVPCWPWAFRILPYHCESKDYTDGFIHNPCLLSVSLKVDPGARVWVRAHHLRLMVKGRYWAPSSPMVSAEENHQLLNCPNQKMHFLLLNMLQSVSILFPK